MLKSFIILTLGTLATSAKVPCVHSKYIIWYPEGLRSKDKLMYWLHHCPKSLNKEKTFGEVRMLMG